MGGISRWAVHKPWQAIVVWIVVIVGIGVGAGLYAGKYNDSFSLPDTESTQATTLLEQNFPGATTPSATIVFTPVKGEIFTPQVAAAITNLATQIEQVPGVKSVQTPLPDPNSAAYQADPITAFAEAGIAGAQAGLVSPDGTVGRAIITLEDTATPVPTEDVERVIILVQNANSSQLVVGVGGQVIEAASTEPPDSEIIGLIAAVVILLIMFGSLVAAGLPIVTALIGMGAGLGLVSIAAKFYSIASFGPTLAAMIGLGVGIDYALFVINRYRQAVIAGKTPREAGLIAVGTAGRAVVFAGTTVMIALLGLFVLGISFMNGLAIGAAVTVFMVMLTAVTLLPAVISALGHKTFAVKMPWAKQHNPKEGRNFSRYADTMQRRPWLFALVSFAAMAALTTPTASMQLGFPDAGGYPQNSPSRIAYDLTTRGFGAGTNGPFLVAVELPEANDLSGAQALSEALSKTEGVAFATPVVADSPTVSADGKVALISVTPSTGPQDQATTALLKKIRDTTIPQVANQTGIKAYVGGTTAVTVDFTAVLAQAIPAFLLIVVALGFVALMALFRSLLIPLTAALTSLLSLGAALGATVAVFQWGHFASLFGISGTGPILPFLPVMLFAILFGLSMDYQVFLVSRMQEEWQHTGDNKTAVRLGLIGSGRVVVAAALIMFSVFISFVFGDNDTIKMFGLALAIAVALDAFVIRLMFVPALMTMLGRSNWYLPGWLGKILPRFSVEGESDSVESTPAVDGDGPDAQASEKKPATSAPQA